MFTRLVTAALVALVAYVGFSVVTSQDADAERKVVCPPVTRAGALEPRSGVWFGVSIDWTQDSLEQYERRLGQAPAVAVTFADMPLSRQELRDLDFGVEQIAATGGRLLLTLEPHDGLDSVTPRAVRRLATRLAKYNERGVPVIVRFGHEMNGSWYPWGQQPKAYVRTFRAMADAIHRIAPGSAMMWAPNYGGGYPFRGGRYWARPGSRNADRLDTNGNGRLGPRDDSYAPYYPGDDAVDWVGMSLYHWGTKHPWGENELPRPGKLAAMLTGRYQEGDVDERALPNFYRRYGEQRDNAVAITETAALYAPGAGGPTALAVKSAWWEQVFDPELSSRFPHLRMINWFEWDKFETEIDGEIRWSATNSAVTRDAFRTALPPWARFGNGRRVCRPVVR